MLSNWCSKFGVVEDRCPAAEKRKAPGGWNAKRRQAEWNKVLDGIWDQRSKDGNDVGNTGCRAVGHTSANKKTSRLRH